MCLDIVMFPYLCYTLTQIFRHKQLFIHLQFDQYSIGKVVNKQPIVCDRKPGPNFAALQIDRIPGSSFTALQISSIDDRSIQGLSKILLVPVKSILVFFKAPCILLL